MKVRFRNGTRHEEVLAYFIDSRRLIGVNLVGHFILDRLFNDECERAQIEQELCQKYHKDANTIHGDTEEFLSMVAKELNPNRYNSNEVGELSSPIGAELEITPSCNLRCSHCLQHNYPMYFMPSEKAFYIMSQLVDAGLCEVSVIGGEPLIHPKAREIITFCAKDLELATSIVTNGTLIDNECVAWMSNLERLSVFVSLDGTEDIHDQIRGLGSYKKANDAIGRLLKARVSVDVLFTLNSLNSNCYREVLAHCHNLGITCNFNLFKPFKPEQKSLVILPNRFFQIMLELFELRQQGNHSIGIANASIVSKLLGEQERNECRACQTGIVITAFGKMITCPSLVETGFYHSDNLPDFDSHFLETWKSHKIFREFRDNGLKGCQARSVIFCQDPRKPDPYGIEAFTDFLNNVPTKIS